MLTALEITNLIKKYNKFNKYHIPLDIIGSESQFNISLQNFIKSKYVFHTYIINYNEHWVYLIIIKTKSKYFYKLLFYDSLGQNIKHKYYNIIEKHCKYCYFIYNKVKHQLSGNTCGYFVIIVYLLVFSLINKNINLINKLLYIIEKNDINNLVEIFIKNESSTKRN